MMILILVICAVAVFFFFRQMKREKGNAEKLKEFKKLEKLKKENASK